MKDKILTILTRYVITRQMFYYILKLKHSKRIKDIVEDCNSRKKLSLFEYEKLASNIESPIEPNEIQFYGFNEVLKKFLGNSKLKKRITNEHGFIFSSFVSNNYSNGDLVLTFSDYREKLIKEKYGSDLEVVKIGPYINYADSLQTKEEHEILKKKMGKILLVFPFHSIDGVLSSFNTDDFIEKIDKYKKEKKIDNVIVCLYWKDIQIGRAEEYIARGYYVTTAGHMHDIYFLNRLRAIIELSDLVISNEVGTYIAYCLCLDKDIQLINQKSEFITEKGNEEHINKKGFSEVEKHLTDYYILQDKLMNVMSSEEIKSVDLDFVKKLFGLQYIRTQEELKQILK